MLGLCRVLLRNREEAEDAAQQTFLSAYGSLLGGAEPRHPAAWLATIARNECWGRIQRRMREPLSDREPEGTLPDPVAAAAARADLAALWRAIAELPRQQRRALLLREFSGLPYDELAAALAVSEPAVESLLFRARRHLRLRLRPAYASAAGVAPLAAIREALARAIGGMPDPATVGGLAKLASAPLAAKLAAGATAAVVTGGTVAVVEHGAISGRERPEVPVTRVHGPVLRADPPVPARAPRAGEARVAVELVAERSKPPPLRLRAAPAKPEVSRVTPPAVDEAAPPAPRAAPRPSPPAPVRTPPPSAPAPAGSRPGSSAGSRPVHESPGANAAKGDEHSGSREEASGAAHEDNAEHSGDSEAADEHSAPGGSEDDHSDEGSPGAESSDDGDAAEQPLGEGGSEAGDSGEGDSGVSASGESSFEDGSRSGESDSGSETSDASESSGSSPAAEPDNPGSHSGSSDESVEDAKIEADGGSSEH